MFKSRNKSRDKPEEKIPSPDDFTNGAIRRAVLAQTVQHPLTIFPFFLSLICVLYIVLMGLSIGAFLAACLSAVGGVGLWAFNFFIRGEKLAEEHVDDLRRRREKGRRHQVSSLAEEFTSIVFEKGIEAANELDEAYQKLRDYLSSHTQKGDMAAQRFIILAEDVYHHGTQVLRQALATQNALQSIDETKLEQETERWKEQLPEAEAESSAKAGALQQKIESHEKRLRLYKERQEKLYYLLAECERLEGALETAYLQVLDLIDRDPDELFKGDTATDLENAMEAARRVEDRLSGRLNNDYSAEDAEYLEAGKNRINS